MRSFDIRETLKWLYLSIRWLLLSPLLLIRRQYPLSEYSVRKILLLRHDRIGDMVVSTPLLKGLKRLYPSASITVLASERNHEVIINNPNVDEILIYRGFFWFIREMRAREFDLAIDPFNSYELIQPLMTYLSGARYRMGFKEAGREIFFNIKGPGLYPSKNLVDHLLDLLSCLGGSTKGLKPEIFLKEEEIEDAIRYLSDMGLNADSCIVAIHPGGYYPSQRWAPERFGQLAQGIVSRYKAGVIAFGSVEDNEILKTIRGMCEKVVPLSGLSLRMLMAVLSRCSLFVGNNSGPLHIAAALGLPTVSITGPTVIPLWLPYGENHIVLRKGLDCSPCNKDICQDHRCMELISVDEVMDAVARQMSLTGYGD